MKIIALLLYLLGALATQGLAQAVFNPATTPIAIEADSVLLLAVSPYTLARSLQKGWPQSGAIQKVEITQKKGEYYLSFTTRPPGIRLLNIRLKKSSNQGLWYADGGVITCGTDCADCDGNCKCGDTNRDCPRFFSSGNQVPLAKINLNKDE